MHIAFLDMDDINNPLLGAGQARATVEVGKRLARMGHTVTSYSSRYPGYKDREEFGITYRHIGIGTKNMKLNNLAYLVSAPLMARNIKADIIIECFTSPISTMGSPLFTKTPVVALPTSFDAARHSALYHIPFTPIERILSRTYKYFMAYTDAYLMKMRAYNPNIDARIIPEGVGDEFFQITLRDPRYILSLGRFDMDQKGIDLLLESYAKVKHKRYPLVIAGKGADKEKIQKKIDDLHLSSMVRIVGPAFNKKKQELLSHALCVVMPSRNEGFSLFSLEALASGLPLITFDIPGFSWTTSPAVLKAPAFDTSQYAALLESAMMGDTLTLRGDAARETAKPYSWDRVAKDFHEYFQYIMKKEGKTV